MDAKDYVHACPKFAESERLDPGGGTILNLALCYEAEGKTATAWTQFNEALSRAIRDGRSEREARARERIAVLGPKLSRLTVVVPSAEPADLQLTVDGGAWGAALRGAAVPLDPGPHVVVARTAGAAPWTTTVTLGPNADAQIVRIPPLGSSTASASMNSGRVTTPSEDAIPSTSGNSRRLAGWLIGGAGVAAVGVGTIFGVLALSRRNDSNGYCNPGCSQQGVDLNNEAITYAWVSDFAIGLGAVGILAGAYWLFSSPDSQPSSTNTSGLRVLPEMLSRGGGAALLVGW
jgi:hypothetical protein